jgi:hypothetical protein
MSPAAINQLGNKLLGWPTLTAVPIGKAVRIGSGPGDVESVIWSAILALAT